MAVTPNRAEKPNAMTNAGHQLNYALYTTFVRNDGCRRRKAFSRHFIMGNSWRDELEEVSNATARNCPDGALYNRRAATDTRSVINRFDEK